MVDNGDCSTLFFTEYLHQTLECENLLSLTGTETMETIGAAVCQCDAGFPRSWKTFTCSLEMVDAPMGYQTFNPSELASSCPDTGTQRNFCFFWCSSVNKKNNLFSDFLLEAFWNEAFFLTELFFL